MVLESVIDPKKAEDKPLEVFFVSLFYSFVAVFFSYTIFPQQSSAFTIALITILFVPFFQKLFSIEERKEELYAEYRKKSFQNLFKRHDKAIITFSAFFLGVVIALSFIFMFFPEYGQVFYLQTTTPPLNKIAAGLTGSAYATNPEANFMLYFLNNSQVMILCFILSVLFGAGAIFILAWNASIIAVYLGLISRSLVATGFNSATAYLFGVSYGLLGIALHGIPEIAAYFFAGLAGGILSIGIIRENFGSRAFKRIFKDSLIFLLIAELLIVVAAFIEAFV